MNPNHRAISLASILNYVSRATTTQSSFTIPNGNKHITVVNNIAPQVQVRFGSAAAWWQHNDVPCLRKQVLKLLPGFTGFEVSDIVFLLQRKNYLQHRPGKLKE